MWVKEVQEGGTATILIQPYFILFLKKEGLGQTLMIKSDVKKRL